MTDRLTPTELDDILALQLSVAWAGERAGEPARLGWWSSDLVDDLGGADLFHRLVPRTAAWASLILVRKVAQRIDEEQRTKLANADAVWTLFRFGFAVDEQLAERLAHHRSHQHVPAEVLGSRFLVGDWSKGRFVEALTALGHPGEGAPGKKASRVEITPGGRHVHATVRSPALAAPLLAAALVPLADAYPMPYVEAP